MIFEVTLSEASTVVTVDWTFERYRRDAYRLPRDARLRSHGEIVKLTVTIGQYTVDEEEEETFTVP